MIKISREIRDHQKTTETLAIMVVQTVAPGFTAASEKDKRDGSRSNTKSATTTKIQWPEFKVSQPDPVLGKISIVCVCSMIMLFICRR